MHWDLKSEKNFSKIHFMKEATVEVTTEVGDNYLGKSITMAIMVDIRLVEK